MRNYQSSLIVAGATLLSACAEDVPGSSQPMSAPETASAGAPNTGENPAVGEESPPGAAPPSLPGEEEAPSVPGFVPGPGGMMRLTATQYHNTVFDLFGVAGSFDVDKDEKGHGFTSVGGFGLTVSAPGVERYYRAASEIAQEVFADEAGRAALVGCTPTATSDACVTEFVGRLGRRMLRRPLTPADMASYQKVVEAGADAYGDVWAGLEYATASLLQAPEFLYVALVGTPDPNRPGWSQLSDYELASRLSYFMWNSTPDEALLSAAEAGELSNPEGVRAQVERMLASPKTEAMVRHFFTEHIGLEDFETVARKDKETYPAATETLLSAMLTELHEVIKVSVYPRGTDFTQIFDTKAAYVNEELAAFYGLPAPASEFQAATFPADSPRAGLLTLGAVLAIKAHPATSSPTTRGVFVRERLLCQSVPPPPDDVQQQVDELLGENGSASELLDEQQANPVCAGCHSFFDPIGQALEHFDGSGEFRQDDNGMPIDTAGDLDGVPFTGASDLATILRNDPRVSECLVRQLYRFATGHRETASEEPIIEELLQLFTDNGQSLLDATVEVASSDGFRYVATSD